MPGVAASDIVVNGGGGLSDRRIRRAVERVLRGERRQARIGVTFLGKSQMRRLNAEYLQHDYPTDVLSFPLLQPDQSIAGDVYICRYVAARNARCHDVTVREELLRLVVHGTLHVLGWDHPAASSRTASPMWQRQERYLADLR